MQGIEALETWVDPNSKPVEEATSENSDATASASAASTNPSPPTIETQADPQPQTTTPPPKPVICKKGKCQPYDPAKDRVSIVR